MPKSRVADEAVHVPAGNVTLAGDLGIPEDAAGIVVFAHGSGSSRHSARNRFVAHALQDAGFATLLMDLLSAQEEEIDARTGQHRFDIPMLARRLEDATSWLREQPATRALDAGYFGASTGGGAALVAAAHAPAHVRAVVSRGGRPDLAGPALGRVVTPTLLIVGGDDAPVIAMNQDAMEQMNAEVKLEIVPGASHLFEEPGALERVAQLARDWFARHLAAA